MPASAMQRVQQSFDVLLEAAREDKPIYGLTRGVGENKDKTVFPGGQITDEGRSLSEAFNANLLRVQATATGPPARVEIVRAAMAIRLNAMLVGHTGVQGVVVQGLVDFLNRGITPVVPTQGTVGEADIDLLAHVGLALMGEGDVSYRGRTVPAATALRDEGLRPVTPFGKDALSTFSSNAYSAAVAVFSTYDAGTVLARARQVFALSMEGLNGNVAPFLAEVQQVRAFPGQAAAAAAVRDELRGSFLYSVDPARALQDPLSYRTFSQVSGIDHSLLPSLCARVPNVRVASFEFSEYDGDREGLVETICKGVSVLERVEEIVFLGDAVPGEVIPLLSETRQPTLRTVRLLLSPEIYKQADERKPQVISPLSSLPSSAPKDACWLRLRLNSDFSKAVEPRAKAKADTDA